MAAVRLDERERDTILLAFSILLLSLENEPQDVQRVVINAVLVALGELLVSFEDDPPEPDVQSLRSSRN